MTSFFILLVRQGVAFSPHYSPRISMRWTLCTKRSRMPSAMVRSPICSCQRETGSWEVRRGARLFILSGPKRQSPPPVRQKVRQGWGTRNDLRSDTHIAPPPGSDHIYIHLPIYEIFGAVIASCPSLRRCLVFCEKSACQIHAARSC